MIHNIKELKKLSLPKGKFAIYGSGPIAVRDLRDSDDIDIIVKEDLWKELILEYDRFYIKGDNHIKIGDVEIWKVCMGSSKDIDKLIDSSETIEGFPFVTLDNVLKWKKEFNRDKDKKDILLIEKYINENNLDVKKNRYFTKPKDYLVLLVGIVGFVYLLNFGFGFVEFLPDNLPIVGNMDEAAALFLIYSTAEYFGINIRSIFKRDNGIKKQDT